MKLGNIFCDDFDKIWNDSSILKELRGIDVDKNLDQECRDCPVKHFCGGGVEALLIKIREIFTEKHRYVHSKMNKE